MPLLAALPELVRSGTRPPHSRNQCCISGINSWSDANYWLARSSVRKAVPESFSVFRRDGPFARPAFELRPLFAVQLPALLQLVPAAPFQEVDWPEPAETRVRAAPRTTAPS